MAKANVEGSPDVETYLFLVKHFIETAELPAFSSTHLKNLSLVEPCTATADFSGTHLKAEGKEAAFVCGDSIISFTDKIQQQQSDDILNSTLFAQLAATKKHDPTTDRIEWFKYFARVMNLMH